MCARVTISVKNSSVISLKGWVYYIGVSFVSGILHLIGICVSSPGPVCLWLNPYLEVFVFIWVSAPIPSSPPTPNRTLNAILLPELNVQRNVEGEERGAYMP